RRRQDLMLRAQADEGVGAEVVQPPQRSAAAAIGARQRRAVAADDDSIEGGGGRRRCGGGTGSCARRGAGGLRHSVRGGRASQAIIAGLTSAPPMWCWRRKDLGYRLGRPAEKRP